MAEVCPTCGSDGRKRRKLIYSQDPLRQCSDYYCSDAWHSLPSEVCPRCGSYYKGKFCLLHQQHVYHTKCNFCPDPWHKVDSLPVEATPTQDRTPQDYAIEHGEYLAQAAAFYLDTRNLADAADEDEEPFDPDRLHDANSALRLAIYEFRKRKEEQDGNSVGGVSTERVQQPVLDSSMQPSGQSAVKRFTIEVLQEKDGRWLADIPSVPGAMGYGKTEWEAVWRSIAIKWEAEKL